MSYEIKVPDNLTEQQMADWLMNEHSIAMEHRTSFTQDAKAAIISATVAKGAATLVSVDEYWDSVLQILKSKL